MNITRSLDSCLLADWLILGTNWATQTTQSLHQAIFDNFLLLPSQFTSILENMDFIIVNEMKFICEFIDLEHT